MPAPDFIIVGMPRSASTWLTSNLMKHSQIYIPSIETVRFFNDKNFERKTVRKEAYVNSDVGKYFDRFKNAPKNTVIGDVNTDYLTDLQVAKRIKQSIPNVKIIMCLRDPVEWVQSTYWWERNSATLSYKSKNFVDAYYKHRSELKLRFGKYIKYVSNYYENFDSAQILVLIYADLKNDPVGTYRKVTDFLGLGTNFVPEDVQQRVRPAVIFRSRLLHNAIDSFTNFLEKYLGRQFEYRLVTNKYLSYVYNLLNRKIQKYPKMPDIVYNELRHYYLADIFRLEKLLQINLPTWKNERA